MEISIFVSVVRIFALLEYLLLFFHQRINTLQIMKKQKYVARSNGKLTNHPAAIEQTKEGHKAFIFGLNSDAVSHICIATGQDVEFQP